MKRDLSLSPEYFERDSDADRRLNMCIKHIRGKRVLDFGCGSGEFLKLAEPYCKDVLGVELENSYLKKLNSEGIHCFKDLEEIEDKSVDAVVCFHVLEHLPAPLEVIKKIIRKTTSGGIVIFEVPHARDALLTVYKNQKFKDFTLWSQHLILHTRDSLERTLAFCGLKDIIIKGVQRYSLSNHLMWLSEGVGGGHKSPLAFLETNYLSNAYEDALANIDATDTIIAIAKIP